MGWSISIPRCAAKDLEREMRSAFGGQPVRTEKSAEQLEAAIKAATALAAELQPNPDGIVHGVVQAHHQESNIDGVPDEFVSLTLNAEH